MATLHSTTMTVNKSTLPLTECLTQAKDDILHDIKGLVQYLLLHQEIFPGEEPSVDYQVQITKAGTLRMVSGDQIDPYLPGCAVIYPDADVEEIYQYIYDDLTGGE